MDDTTPVYRAVAATIDPTSSNDEQENWKVGSRWANTTTKRIFECTDASAGSATWTCSTMPSAGMEILSLNGNTSDTFYTFVGAFPFAGTAVVGLQSLHVVASVDSPNTSFTFDVRVIDHTNSNAVVAEAVGLSGDNMQIHDLGALSNLPTTAAVFVLELRRSGTPSSNIATIFSLRLTHS